MEEEDQAAEEVVVGTVVPGAAAQGPSAQEGEGRVEQDCQVRRLEGPVRAPAAQWDRAGQELEEGQVGVLGMVLVRVSTSGLPSGSTLGG